MTKKVSKGLEFPVVALPGVWCMPATSEYGQEGARVLCVAAARTPHRLEIWAGEGEGYGQRATGNG